MESVILEETVSQGIWAVLSIFLFIYIVKSNENYKILITELLDKYDILDEIKRDAASVKTALNQKEE